MLLAAHLLLGVLSIKWAAKLIWFNINYSFLAEISGKSNGLNCLVEGGGKRGNNLTHQS